MIRYCGYEEMQLTPFMMWAVSLCFNFLCIKRWDRDLLYSTLVLTIVIFKENSLIHQIIFFSLTSCNTLYAIPLTFIKVLKSPPSHMTKHMT